MKLVFLQRDKRPVGKRICRDSGTAQKRTVLFVEDIAFLIFEWLSDMDIIHFSSTCKFMRSIFKSCHFFSSVNPLSRRFMFDANSHIHSLSARLDIEDSIYTLQFPGRIPHTDYEFLDIRFYDKPRRDGVNRAYALARINMYQLIPSNQRLRQVHILPSKESVFEVNHALDALCRQLNPPKVVVVNDLSEVTLTGGMARSPRRINLIVIRTRRIGHFWLAVVQYMPFAHTVMVVNEDNKIRCIVHRNSLNHHCEVLRNEARVDPECKGTCKLCKFIETGPKWETDVFLKEFGNGETRLFRTT